MCWHTARRRSLPRPCVSQAPSLRPRAQGTCACRCAGVPRRVDSTPAPTPATRGRVRRVQCCCERRSPVCVVAPASTRQCCAARSAPPAHTPAVSPAPVDTTIPPDTHATPALAPPALCSSHAPVWGATTRPSLCPATSAPTASPVPSGVARRCPADSTPASGGATRGRVWTRGCMRNLKSPCSVPWRQAVRRRSRLLGQTRCSCLAWTRATPRHTRSMAPSSRGTWSHCSSGHGRPAVYPVATPAMPLAKTAATPAAPPATPASPAPWSPVTPPPVSPVLVAALSAACHACEAVQLASGWSPSGNAPSGGAV